MVGKVRSARKEVISTHDFDDDDGDYDMQNNKKKMKLLHQIEDNVYNNNNNNNGDDQEHNSGEEQDDEVDEEEEGDDATPIGDVIRVSEEKGLNKKKHFREFKFDGRRFKLDDPVLVAPDEGIKMPSVAVIKDIFETENGDLMVIVQRFYRPEEAEKREGGTWETRDTRELYYSYNFDEVPADSVMHKCRIHLVPLLKPVPDRKLNPGFIVQKVYDHVKRRLRDLTDRDCKEQLKL